MTPSVPGKRTGRSGPAGQAKAADKAKAAGKPSRSPAVPRRGKAASSVQAAATSAAPPATSGSAGPAADHRLIYILSDSTGNLPRHMITAFLTQFPPVFDVRARNYLQSPNQVSAALAQAQREPGIVFHAMVSEDAKRQIARFCQEAGLPHCDLTGEFVSFIACESGVMPRQDPKLLHEANASYFRRIEAMEFALQHDDGLGLSTLHQAQIVLTGVSRTSKTPTTIYLAQQGFKVANVSLAYGVAPPEELLALPPRTAVGLVIDPHQLAEIRNRRRREWGRGGPGESYSDLEAVSRELQWSRRLFAEHGWPVLNVTDQAVEETAAHVLNLLGLNHGGPPLVQGR